MLVLGAKSPLRHFERALFKQNEMLSQDRKVIVDLHHQCRQHVADMWGQNARARFKATLSTRC